VHVKAQLLDFVDNKGNVVYSEIVPDGSHHFIIDALVTKILPFQDTIFTKCFYTDKAVADVNLAITFDNFYKKFSIDNKTVIQQGIFN